MNLVTMPFPTGATVGAWRHPNAFNHTVMNFEPLLQVTKTAERGLFDAVFFADGNAVRNLRKPTLFAALMPSDRPATFEPLTLLAALAMHTKNIGLVATATTTYEAPYSLARKLATIDHLSGGRAGWNIVTSSESADSLSFGFDEHMSREARYAKAHEFVDVVKELWDSWADDAFLEDKHSGQYLDPSRVHAIDYRGEFLSVKGALNALRPIQGYPVFFTAGQSEPGLELAAKKAEGLFAMCSSRETCKNLADDIKKRVENYGRPSDKMKILPGVGFFAGETEAEAERFYTELAALIPPSIGVAYLEKLLSVDLQQYGIGEKLPAIDSTEVLGINSMRKTIAAQAEAEGWTIRQTYEHVVMSLGQPVVKGSARHIADFMEEWYTTGACDGFMVQSPMQPVGLERFVDLVVPELQRRGIFRMRYESETLRGNLGLDVPENQFFPSTKTSVQGAARGSAGEPSSK